MNSRPTMKDVAAHAGVSLSTVSYVLNESGPVSPARKARVLNSVRALNYTPNESARSLKSSSSKTIALVIPQLTNQFFALLAQGVERVASANGLLVVLCSPETTEEAESQNIRLLKSQRVDGFIYLSAFGTSLNSIVKLASHGPMVLVDEKIPGLDLPSVVSDSRRGAREIASYVIEQGHERIGIIGGPEALWTAQQRLAGYREALASAGHDLDNIPYLAGDYSQESGVKLAEQLLKVDKKERPTALLCANDLMAIGAIEYCKGAGIKVPEDVSVAGFDDLPVASLLSPRLTTVRQPAVELGQRAANILLELLGKNPVTQKDEQFPTTLEIRDSVAKLPRKKSSRSK